MRVGHATEDKVCLEHALGWLHTLCGTSDSQDGQALIETYIQRARELKQQDAELLGLLRKFRDMIQDLDCPPSRVFAQMESTGSENGAQFTLTAGMTSSDVKWDSPSKCPLEETGSRTLASLDSQILLRVAEFKKVVPLLGQMSHALQKMNPQSELVCQAAVNLAFFLADQGDYGLAKEQLSYAASICPVGSPKSEVVHHVQ